MSTDREELKRRIRERLAREKKKPAKRRVPLKPIAGVIVTIAGFALMLLALNATLGWPTSWFTLVLMLGVAWVVGAIAGERLARGWSVIAGLALAMGLVVSTWGFGIPWKIAEIGEGEVITYENFLYHASFTYRGSEENLPIENVAIRLPYPNVENRTESVYFGVIWGLYWVDNDNTLHLQATETTIYELKGERTETLHILIGPQKNPTPGGPKSTWVVDRLYPREVFMDSGLISVPTADANKLTLKIYSDNEGRSSAAFAHLPNPNIQDVSAGGPFDKPIDVSFWAQLSKPVNDNYEIVEAFSRSIDNETWGMLWLYPS